MATKLRNRRERWANLANGNLRHNVSVGRTTSATRRKDEQGRRLRDCSEGSVGADIRLVPRHVISAVTRFERVLFRRLPGMSRISCDSATTLPCFINNNESSYYNLI